MDAAYNCGCRFGWAKANLELMNRAAVHASLLSLYGLGGWLVNKVLMPFRWGPPHLPGCHPPRGCGS